MKAAAHPSTPSEAGRAAGSGRTPRTNVGAGPQQAEECRVNFCLSFVYHVSRTNHTIPVSDILTNLSNDLHQALL
jgi:hypothetical protein